MTERIPQSTSKLVVFKAYLASDHTSEATGKTIAITISKNGGAFGNPNAGATNATEISSGWYKVTLDTTDTGTAGPLAVRGAVATIDDVGVLLEVVKATNGGYTALPDTACTTNASLLTSGTGTAQLSVSSGQVDLGKILTTAVSTPATAGILDVNVKNIDNDATSASGTVTFPNATLASTTNITAGTIATVTTVTNQLTAAQIATGVWQDTTAGDFTTALSVGKSIMNGVSLGTGLTVAAVSGAVGSVTGAVGSVTGAVGSVTGNVGGNVTGSVGSVAAAGITAASFAANAITAAKLDPDVTTELQAGLATAAALAVVDGIVDDILLDTAEIGTAGAGLTNINLPNQTMDIVGNITGNLSGSVGSVTGLTVATIADQVWEETLADHSGTVGSTAEALNAAGAAGDPWTTALPGAYGAGSAGNIVGNNLNAPVGTIDTVVDAIKVKTDSLTFTVAGQVDSNIQYVNDTLVTGNGSAGTPWGP